MIIAINMLIPLLFLFFVFSDNEGLVRILNVYVMISFCIGAFFLFLSPFILKNGEKQFKNKDHSSSKYFYNPIFVIISCVMIYNNNMYGVFSLINVFISYMLIAFIENEVKKDK